MNYKSKYCAFIKPSTTVERSLSFCSGFHSNWGGLTKWRILRAWTPTHRNLFDNKIIPSIYCSSVIIQSYQLSFLNPSLVLAPRKVFRSVPNLGLLIYSCVPTTFSVLVTRFSCNIYYMLNFVNTLRIRSWETVSGFIKCILRSLFIITGY